MKLNMGRGVENLPRTASREMAIDRKVEHLSRNRSPKFRDGKMMRKGVPLSLEPR